MNGLGSLKAAMVQAALQAMRLRIMLRLPDFPDRAPRISVAERRVRHGNMRWARNKNLACAALGNEL